MLWLQEASSATVVTTVAEMKRSLKERHSSFPPNIKGLPLMQILGTVFNMRGSFIVRPEHGPEHEGA